MVIYDLQCSLGHKFEGWFPNSEAFDKQREMKILQCSVCGIPNVEKLPSVIHTAASHSAASQSKILPNTPQKKKMASEVATVNVDPIVLVKAVQQYVKTNFKNVGNKFADRATEMHRGDQPHENIYGSATQEQCEKLEDEGVSFFVFPKTGEEFEN